MRSFINIITFRGPDTPPWEHHRWGFQRMAHVCLVLLGVSYQGRNFPLILICEVSAFSHLIGAGDYNDLLEMVFRFHVVHHRSDYVK